MSKRVEAVKRVLAFIWGNILSLLGFVVLFVGLIWMILDVLWQFFLGREGLDPNGRIATWIRAWFNWAAQNRNYAITGKGDLTLLPSSSMG